MVFMFQKQYFYSSSHSDFQQYLHKFMQQHHIVQESHQTLQRNLKKINQGLSKRLPSTSQAIQASIKIYNPQSECFWKMNYQFMDKEIHKYRKTEVDDKIEQHFLEEHSQVLHKSLTTFVCDVFEKKPQSFNNNYGSDGGLGNDQKLSQQISQTLDQSQFLQILSISDQKSFLSLLNKYKVPHQLLIKEFRQLPAILKPQFLHFFYQTFQFYQNFIEKNFSDIFQVTLKEVTEVSNHVISNFSQINKNSNLLPTIYKIIYTLLCICKGIFANKYFDKYDKAEKKKDFLIFGEKKKKQKIRRRNWDQKQGQPTKKMKINPNE